MKSLNHHSIPKHIDCFDTKNSFCLIQEYPSLKPLTLDNEYTLEEIKKITISILNIITYLQQ